MQHHSIDVHLRRWLPAVENLVAAGSLHFDAALALAEQHGLLRPLLQLCRDSPACHTSVLVALGQQLKAQRRHEDAAVAFMAAGKLEQAVDAYR